MGILLRAFPLATLLLLLTLALVPVPSSPAPSIRTSVPVSTAVAPTSSILTSTAQRHIANSTIFHQTGTALYQGRSLWANITFNLARYSQVYTEAMSFYVAAQSTYGATVLVYQGSTVLANRTTGAGLAFTLTPALSSTPVTERIVAVQSLNGSVPLVGSYSVYTNVSESIQFAAFASDTWAYNTGLFNYSTYQWVNSSFSLWLNGSALSVPFPVGLQANLTTIVVLVNGTAATYSVGTNSVTVLIQNLKPGGTAHVLVSFLPLPSVSGGPVAIGLVGGRGSAAANNYSYGYTWTDGGLTAYNGVYVLSITSYNGSLSQVSVRINGILVPPTRYVVTTNVTGHTNVTVLPGTATVYLTEAILFTVNFVGSPATGANLPGNSIIIAQSGSVTITLGDVWLAGIVLAGFWLLYEVITLPLRGLRPERAARLLLTTAWGSILAVFVFLALYVIGV